MKKRFIIILVVAALVLVAAIPFAFFVFTSTASQPQAAMMTLDKESRGTDTSARVRITFLLYGADGVYGYEGSDVSRGRVYSWDGEVRDFLIETLRRNGAGGVEVKIRTSKSAAYQNVVNMLDEMAINTVKWYTLNEASEQEQAFANTLEQGK